MTLDDAVKALKDADADYHAKAAAKQASGLALAQATDADSHAGQDLDTSKKGRQAAKAAVKAAVDDSFPE